MDTIKKSKYEDTNKIFEPPKIYDFIIKEKNAIYFARKIRDKIISKNKYSMFIGRFQPLHLGHIKLIQTVLDENKKVLIALRDTPIEPNNPFSITERMKMFSDIFGEKVKVIIIPDISEVCYGRNVGWDMREIKLSEHYEKISSTKIRNFNENLKNGLEK